VSDVSEARERLRRRHKDAASTIRPAICAECGERQPCSASLILDELTRVESENRELRPRLAVVEEALNKAVSFLSAYAEGTCEKDDEPIDMAELERNAVDFLVELNTTGAARAALGEADG